MMSSGNSGYRSLKSPRSSFGGGGHFAVDVDGGAVYAASPSLRRTNSVASMPSFSSSLSISRQIPHVETADMPGHENRFLSEDEKLLATNPLEAKRSFMTLNNEDQKTWHLLSLDTVSKMLNTSFERGIVTLDHERRLSRYGTNELEQEPRTPVYIVFLLQFYNLIMALLLFAAVLAIGFQEFVEGIAVLFIVVLNAIIATYQEHSAGNALEALAQMSSPQTVVIRDGVQELVESKTLVPGDIVVLMTGDIVPADIRLVHSVNLKVNEMLLTGESEDVSKKYNAPRNDKSTKLTADNMVFSSTTVTEGNARGVVVETGMHTRVGSIAALLKSSAGPKRTEETDSMCRNPIADCLEKYQPKQTPLQHSLHRLGLLMGIIAVSVCACVFVVGYVRGNKDPKHPDRAVWLNMIMLAVSLAVSAVPEGLPMVVTVCLSSGTVNMVKKNVLVRKLTAVETLGAASVICTDKTGTLTEGKMTAVKMWTDFTEYDITGKGFTPEGAILLNGVNQIYGSAQNHAVRSTLLASVLCSNTKLKEVEVDGVTMWQPFGNSSEAPLVVAAAKADIWEEPANAQYKRTVELPFSSMRKMMITVNELPPSREFGTIQLDPSNAMVACVKGAPNYILKGCTHYCKTDGTFAELTREQHDEVMHAVDQLSSQALRVLAVAIRPMPSLPYPVESDEIEQKFAALAQGLTFMGLVASIDPERDGVRDAIQVARMASIRTVMITGDYLKTAVAIAKNIDLLEMGADPDFEATDCEKLRPGGKGYLPDHELDEITSRTLVFARAKPEDKIEIVKSLQRQGLISSMTGDGVNDAPALKAADIGVAMGISGTEVAKGASDMILTDDNFVSIVAAVEQGRVIYANIQKFVMFFLSTNIGEIVMIFSTIAAGCPTPMEALQILMLNLFSDGMPAVALSLEKGDPNIMENKPRPKTQPLIHGRLWSLILFNALLIATGALAAFMLGLYWNFGVLLQKDIFDSGGGSRGSDFLSVTCNRWEGVKDEWRVYGNCEARYDDGSYVFGDLENRDYFENSTMYCEGGEYDCLSEGLARAQTMTFVTLAFMEVLRAYTVRSFTESMLLEMFSNKFLNLASLLSICLTILITNVPVIMDDLFGFEYIYWWQWLAAVAIGVHAAFWSEMFKMRLRHRDREFARWGAMREGLDTILLELRHVHQRLDRFEK